MTDICPFCGAYSPRSCELEEETGGECPWQEVLDEEPDVDRLREDRDERRRLTKEYPDAE